MLVDGFDMVLDLKRSAGSTLYDARSGKRYLDFFTFFASSPVGLNHPKLFEPDFTARLLYAAANKPSNSDVYTVEMAEFLETFSRVGIPSYLPYAFFVSGGALAVENALKTAFDWKVRKNFARGHREERGHAVIHFRQAFHGRSGYTMTLTNTDPTKVRHFPKFAGWPRISNPFLRFPLTAESLADVEERERQAVREMETAFAADPDGIAAIIIEPIQGEGGDNHFRREFFLELRRLADEHEALLIFDEVQTGVGMTGAMWAHQHFVEPDIISFGKKMQVCGILAGRRIDEVTDNVFRMSSRINSTWGGSLVDMMRAQRYLEIIEEERLVDNAARMGAHLLGRIQAITEAYPALASNPRGRGLFCAFDLPSAAQRAAVVARAYERGLIILGCGERSIRFRPALAITRDELDEGLAILTGVLREQA
jgi:L-lysine 6-transaminase